MIDAVPQPLFILSVGLIGLFVGSGIANIAWCWPDRLAGLWSRRSSCENCATTLGPIDLLPLAGWFIRKGQCAYCKSEIPSYYWQIELAAALIAAIAFATKEPLAGTILTATGWILLLLARIDLDHFLLPNVLTFPLIGTGLLASLWPHWPGPEFLDASIGALAGYGLLAGVRWAYFRYKGVEGLGLGDAKLFAAAGAFCGWAGLPNILLFAAGSCLVIALIGGHSLKSQKPIPFGPALAAALFLQLLLSWPIR